MKRLVQVSIIIVVVAIFLVLSGTFYTVEEGQQAVIVQFGRPVGETVTEAGLHVKLPFVQGVRRFEKRLLTWDGDPNQIPTKGREFIWVDTTARWRIADAKKFLENVASEEGAQSRLDDIIDSVVRDQVSSSELVELVRSASWEVPAERAEEIKKEVAAEREAEIKKEVARGREEITRTILAEARKIIPQYGIELVDVRIKRLDYIESVRERVYARMISERKRIAAQFRSEGEGRSAEILGTMEKDLRQIRSDRLPASAGTPGRGRRGGDAHLRGGVQSRSRVLCLLAHAGTLWRGRAQELGADPDDGQRLLPLSQARGARRGRTPASGRRARCQATVARPERTRRDRGAPAPPRGRGRRTGAARASDGKPALSGCEAHVLERCAREMSVPPFVVPGGASECHATVSHARLAGLVEEVGEVKFMGRGGRADADTYGMSPCLPA